MCVVEPEICWWRWWRGTADVGLRERMTRSMGLGLGLADRRPGLAGTWHYSALLMVGTGTGVHMSELGLGGTGDVSPVFSAGTETVIYFDN